MTIGTHAAQLERWLGKENVEQVSRLMLPWYGRPIALAGVPGNVRVYPGGDIRGRIKTGAFASALDVAEGLARRFKRGVDAVAKNHTQLNAGFASLSDFIAAASNPGNQRSFPFTKVGASGVANVSSSLWQSSGSPAAGAAGSAAPGGRACDSSVSGAFPLVNAGGGQTMKWAAGYPSASVAGNTLLLYDRLFDVAKTMSSLTTEAVTGVPGRYTNTSTTADDSIIGNFLFVEVQAALGATAHNWTVCQYTNQAGTTGLNMPSLTGNSSAVLQRLDHPTGQWFAPLNGSDSGIKALTQMQCSASVTGSINFVIGHPVAWLPCPVAAQVCFVDGITCAFERIFDNACLSFLEVTKVSGTATTYSGSMTAICS